MTLKAWQVEESRVLFERKWLTLREDRVRLSNGATIDEYHVLELPDWVGTLALTDHGEIALVEQYRHGLGSPTLELPAGVIEPGEQPLDAARRELLEETGYAADDWLGLGALSPEPNRQNNRAHFFVARHARRVAEPNLDQCEQIETRLIPVTELLAQIASGRLLHAVHIAAILLAIQRGLVEPSSAQSAR